MTRGVNLESWLHHPAFNAVKSVYIITRDLEKVIGNLFGRMTLVKYFTFTRREKKIKISLYSGVSNHELVKLHLSPWQVATFDYTEVFHCRCGVKLSKYDWIQLLIVSQNHTFRNQHKSFLRTGGRLIDFYEPLRSGMEPTSWLGSPWSSQMLSSQAR